MQVRKDPTDTGARAWSCLNRFFVGLLLLLSGNHTSVVSLKSCKTPQIHYNVTLYGGIAAGTFAKMDRVDPDMCARLCCRQQSCDLAFSVDRMCYNVNCKNTRLCQTKPALHSKHNTVVTYVTRGPEDRNQSRIMSKTKDFPSFSVSSNTERTSSSHRAVKNGSNLARSNSNFLLKTNEEGGKNSLKKNRHRKPEHASKTSHKSFDVHRHSGRPNRREKTHKEMQDGFISPLSSGTPSKREHKFIQLQGGRLAGLTIANVPPDVSTNLDLNDRTASSLPPGFFLRSGPRSSHSQQQHYTSLSAGTVSSLKLSSTSRANNTSSDCKAHQILQNVTLRSGLKSGEFTDYGLVKNMSTCVGYCCQQQNCDVALLLGLKCYALHCFNPALCKVRSAHSAALNPRVAFVSRLHAMTDDRQGEGGLNLRVKSSVKKHTAKLAAPKPVRASHSSAKSHPACPSGAVLSDVTLRGGRRAGKFKLRAVSRDIHKCIKICCDSPSCDVAWVLGQYCYSVECHSRDQCKPVKGGDGKIRSQLSLVSRKHEQGASQKRQEIPGAKKAMVSKDLHFMIHLNLTSEHFTEALKSDESLEFLNLAERIETTIAAVFVGDASYTDATVQSFGPTPQMCKFKMTLKAGAPVRRTLETLVEAVKKKTLKASIDGDPISIGVSTEGLQFDTSAGCNLVCDPEHEFDVSWGLAVFNSTDHRPCPRGSKGMVQRKCKGESDTNATWATPDFSECVSPAYQRFYDQSKRFAEGAKSKVSLKELQSKIGVTPDKLLDELEKTVFLDSYRQDIEKTKNRTHAKSRVVHGKTKSTIVQKKKKKLAAHNTENHPNSSTVIVSKPLTEHHSAPLQIDSPSDFSPPKVTMPQSKPKVLPINAEQKNSNGGGTGSVWFSSPKVFPSRNANIPQGPEREATAVRTQPPLIKRPSSNFYPGAKRYSVPKESLPSRLPSQNIASQARDSPAVRNSPLPGQQYNPGLLRQGRPTVNSLYQNRVGQNRNYFSRGDSNSVGIQRQRLNQPASRSYSLQPQSSYAGSLANSPAPQPQSPYNNQPAGRQALQTGTAGMVPNMYGQSPLIAASNYGRIFPGPIRYGGQRFDIGRKKRATEGYARSENNLSLNRNKRQNTVWYNTRTYPQTNARNNLPLAATNSIYQTHAQTSGNVNQNVAGTYGIQYGRRPAAPQRPYGPYPQGPPRPALGPGANPGGAMMQGPYVPSQGALDNARIRNPLTSSETRNGAFPGSVASSTPLGGNPVSPRINYLRQQEVLARRKQAQAQAQAQLNRTASKPKLLDAADRSATPRKKPAILANSGHITQPQETHTVQPNPRTKSPTQLKESHSEEMLAKKMHEMMMLSPSKPHAKSAVLSPNNSASLVKQKHLAPMFGGDLLLAADTLKLLQRLYQYAEPTTTRQQVKKFVNVSSHILDLNNKAEWINTGKRLASLKKKGMNILEDSNVWDWEHSKKLDKTSNVSEDVYPVLSLVRTVQSYVMNASRKLESDLREPIFTKNIMIGLQVFNPSTQDSTRPISFPNFSDPKVANWSDARDSFSFKPVIFQNAVKDKNEKVHMVNSRFKTVADLVPQTTSTSGPGGEVDNSTIISSAIVSSIANPGPGSNLEPPVKIVLAHKDTFLSQFEQQCVAWVPADRTQEGEWSSEGCSLVDSNKTHVTCACSHMTDFAVLTNTLKLKNGVLVSQPPPSKAVPTRENKPSMRMSVLLAILLLLLIVLIILGILFVVWRRRKARENQEQDSAGKTGTGRSSSASRSSGSQHSPTIRDDESRSSSQKSEFDEMISARKKRIAQDKERKLQSGEDKDELLMKEKALLFSDYHQPYHFLSDSTDPSQQASGSTDQRSTRRSRSSRSDRRPRERREPGHD